MAVAQAAPLATKINMQAVRNGLNEVNAERTPVGCWTTARSRAKTQVAAAAALPQELQTTIRIVHHGPNEENADGIRTGCWLTARSLVKMPECRTRY